MGDMFLDSYSKLPQKMQKKAREQIEKFRTNPRAGGMHYEKLKHSNDANYHSFKLNDNYRAIVYEPKDQEIYILVHVADHEGAYNWANTHTMGINPITGSIQVLDVESIKDTVAKIPEDKKSAAQGLFKNTNDKHLLQLGIPEILLPAIRAIDAEWELDKLQGHLPQESTDALFMLAAGFTLEETIADFEEKILQEEEPAEIDVNDYSKALNNTSTQLRFCLVEDENAMSEILNAPLDKWRVFLHPSQKKIVTLNSNGPIRVLGGAGTGKTVVALHRAKWLAENFAKEGEKVLFTTFTVNLAADIQENLKKICSTETLKKIEVKSIDSWVSDFLRSRNYNHKISFGKIIDELWVKAFDTISPDYNLDFLKDEWDLVIQNHGVESEKDYLRIKRPGRGKRLNRSDRKKIWAVFDEFKTLKRNADVKELQDATRDAKVLIKKESTYANYCSIIVDEAQDMKPEVYKLLRSLIPLKADEKGMTNDLFIVGDGHQKVYKNHIKLSDYNIGIRGRNRSFKLKLNYRTTEEIRKWAVAYVENRKISDLDGEEDTNKGYRSLYNGNEPVYKKCKDKSEEVSEIVKYLDTLKAEEGFALNNVCMVGSTMAEVDDYKSKLEAEGISCYQLKRKHAEDRVHKGLRVATMYRVKGLEFDHVILCGFQEKPVIHANTELDEQDKIENETRHRSLIYVAASRAKKTLFITGYRK